MHGLVEALLGRGDIGDVPGTRSWSAKASFCESSNDQVVLSIVSSTTIFVKIGYFPWKCTNLSGKIWVAADRQRRRNNVHYRKISIYFRLHWLTPATSWQLWQDSEEFQKVEITKLIWGWHNSNHKYKYKYKYKYNDEFQKKWW